MALIVFKPTSPGRRGTVKVKRTGLYKGRPEASLTEKKSKTGGRNNYGRITTRHIGGGHKQKYRIIDFKRNKDDIAAKLSLGDDWHVQPSDELISRLDKLAGEGNVDVIY